MVNITSERYLVIDELSQLMREKRPFSYLRMGDGELGWLLNMQKNAQPVEQRSYSYQQGASVDAAYGVRGVRLDQYERLRSAYENCSFLDLQQNYPYNQNNVDLLNLEYSCTTRKTSSEASMLLYEWVYCEFSNYVSNRRCLFVSAESPLLEQLYKDSRYREAAKQFWADNTSPFFLKVRNDGRYYWDCLDEIKTDIREKVIAEGIDTVFISLGSGAKILCYELANELNICTFDFGAAIRGLTYAGSPGYHAARGTHTPFFFRLPLEVYMEAVMKAYPDMSIADILSKAHAQLCLDLQKKRVAASSATDVRNLDNFDPNPENLRHFWKNYHFYRQNYLSIAKENDRARELVDEFVRYRRFKGLGMDGRIYTSLLTIKRLLKSIVKPNST